MDDEGTPARNDGGFRRKVVVAVGITVALVLIVYLTAHLLQILLMMFGGVLLGVILRGATLWVHRKTHLPVSAALASVLVLSLGAIAAAGFFMAPQISEQVQLLVSEMPGNMKKLQAQHQGTMFGQILSQVGSAGQKMMDPKTLLGPLQMVFSSAIGFLTGIVVVFFLAVYLAASPKLYVEGAVSLLPRNKHDRARSIILETAKTLRAWTLGQAIAMVFLGVVTGIGLALMGIKLALVLALLGALLNFVPYVGPLAATGVAVLVTLPDGGDKALMVLVLYLAAQTVESYILTPLVQRREVSLPPAVTIAAEAILGTLGGVLGIVFATPIAAAGLVLVRRIYVEGTLKSKAMPTPR